MKKQLQRKLEYLAAREANSGENYLRFISEYVEEYKRRYGEDEFITNFTYDYLQMRRDMATGE